MILLQTGPQNSYRLPTLPGLDWLKILGRVLGYALGLAFCAGVWAMFFYAFFAGVLEP